MAKGVVVKGVRKTIRVNDRALSTKRKILRGRVNRVAADLLRKGRDNSPVQEGTHVDSMDFRVIDKGWGHGFVIEVTGGDTPYSLWLHEGRYQAHPPHGTSSFTRIVGGGRTVTIGGVRAMSIPNKQRGGFWWDSKGNMRGRKFLERALDENWRKYERWLSKPL